MLELDEDQRFAEPVALSSTQPADRPLSRRALRPSLDLVTLRARRTEEPKRWSCDGQAAAEALITDGRRAEADAELARALAYFRSVRATAYTGRGEALLAASA